jgi:NADP-dependent 3-hydroxy acid dehydrogenase YdfG
MKLKPVEEQVVVLMGASSGIGRETALRFAERGAKVVVSARSEEGLESLVREIRGRGGEATAVAADVADFEQVEAVAGRAAEAYGRLDTWVHLAGVSVFAPFDRTTPEEFRRVVEIDLLGQAYGAMAALPHIKRNGGGALIHISSMGAKRSIPLEAPITTTTCSPTGLSRTITPPCTSYEPSNHRRAEKASPRSAEEPSEGGHERIGALDVGQVAAVGYELQRTFPKAGGRVSCLGLREHPVARPPHHERRHLQEGETVHQDLALAEGANQGA